MIHGRDYWKQMFERCTHLFGSIRRLFSFWKFHIIVHSKIEFKVRHACDPYTGKMLLKGTSQNQLATPMAPKLMIRAIKKLTSLLSSKPNEPLSTTRLGFSSPKLGFLNLTLASYLSIPPIFWSSSCSTSSFVGFFGTVFLPSPLSRLALISARFVQCMLLGPAFETRTLFPPSPSTMRPLLVSTTLCCSQPPRKLSRTLPRAPHIAIANVNLCLLIRFQPFGSRTPDADFGWQNGIKAIDAVTIIRDPKKPAMRPYTVTPPFVPGGTFRRLREVMSRGRDFDRIPSSELNVSAATAA